MMHHYTKFGDKTLSNSEDIFWTKPDTRMADEHGDSGTPPKLCYWEYNHDLLSKRA